MNDIKLNVIAAMSLNKVIGNNDQIPWKILGEQFLFKMLTINKKIIMGRKTYESLGKPLPDRENIILTRQKDYEAPGCLVINDLFEYLLKLQGNHEVFIIGGGEIYKECIDVADTIYLTVLQKEVEGNVFFPKIDETLYNCSVSTSFHTNETFKIHLYQRKKRYLYENSEESIFTKSLTETQKEEVKKYIDKWITAIKISDVLKQNLKDAPFSDRTKRLLKRMGFETYEDIVKYTEEDFLKLRDIGVVTLEEIKNGIRFKGLKFKESN